MLNYPRAGWVNPFASRARLPRPAVNCARPVCVRAMGETRPPRARGGKGSRTPFSLRALPNALRARRCELQFGHLPTLLRYQPAEDVRGVLRVRGACWLIIGLRGAEASPAGGRPPSITSCTLQARPYCAVLQRTVLCCTVRTCVCARVHALGTLWCGGDPVASLTKFAARQLSHPWSGSAARPVAGVTAAATPVAPCASRTSKGHL